MCDSSPYVCAYTICICLAPFRNVSLNVKQYAAVTFLPNSSHSIDSHGTWHLPNFFLKTSIANVKRTTGMSTLNAQLMLL